MCCLLTYCLLTYCLLPFSQKLRRDFRLFSLDLTHTASGSLGQLKKLLVSINASCNIRCFSIGKDYAKTAVACQTIIRN
jgi:hypothetical protein